MNTSHLIEKINALKKEKNAVILVHNYQSPEIYKVADFLGDSLDLSRKAAKTDNDIIVFCGVHFMAETAKILNPSKIVLLPALDAGCPMADMATLEGIEQLKKKHPGAAVACYVNTTAEIKAVSDICVTSANAVQVINFLKEDTVLFVPDKNLAYYVAQHTKKTIIPYEGFCHVHQRFTKKDIEKARKIFPDAPIIAHPECPPEVLKLADYVSSTSGMINVAKNLKAKEIIIATEIGMIERLQLELPAKKFYSLGSAKICVNMKKTTLEHVYNSLLKEQYQIHVPEHIAAKAKICVERMLAVM